MLTRQLLAKNRFFFTRFLSSSSSSSSKNYICDASAIEAYRTNETFKSIVDRGDHHFFYKTNEQSKEKPPTIFKEWPSTSDPPKDPIQLTKSLVEEMVTVTRFNERSHGRFPSLIGLEVIAMRPGFASMQLKIREELLAPNGYLHAGVVVTLADTACGYGCIYSKPANAKSFTTIELKSNFMGTAKPNSVLNCEARLVHGGKTTQVWDAEVREAEKNKLIAAFRCTELLIY